MDQLAIHRIAEAAQVDALLVDQRSEHSFVFADTARVSDRDDLLPSLIGMLFAAGEKHLFVERWDAVNHIVQPEWTKLSKWDEAKLSVETLLDMTTGMNSDLTLAGTIGHSHTYEPVMLEKLIEILETQTAQPIDEILASWLRDPLSIEPEHCQLSWDARTSRWRLSASMDAIHQLGIAMLDAALFDGSYLMAMREPAQSSSPHFRLLWWNDCRALHEERGIAPPSSVPGDLLVATLSGKECLAISGELDVALAISATSQPTETHLALELLADPLLWEALS